MKHHTSKYNNKKKKNDDGNIIFPIKFRKHLLHWIDPSNFFFKLHGQFFKQV